MDQHDDRVAVQRLLSLSRQPLFAGTGEGVALTPGGARFAAGGGR